MTTPFDFPPTVWLAVIVVTLAAGLTQGTFGFGFPALATPLFVLLTDVKTAILLNLLPNFTLNVISTLRGGNLRESIGKYWPVAAYMLVGSVLGAQFLIHAPQDPVRLLLAASIIAYLYQERLAHLRWGWLTRHPRASVMAFGLAGGFFSGSVNQSLPPLLIYFTRLAVPVLAMTQALNLCFLGGKTMQAITLALAGEIRISSALANIPLTLVALAGLYAGGHIQRRFSARTYTAILRWVLLAIAITLFAQGMPWLWRS
jgi:uncharacterized membrane protein YfcA